MKTFSMFMCILAATSGVACMIIGRWDMASTMWIIAVMNRLQADADE